MPHHVKRIARTTAAKSATYAGPAGELVMDITNNDLVLQNGQAGGVRLAKASTVIDATNGVNITTGGTLGDTTVVSGVDASTAAKGVVQLSNATDGTSQTMAATPKAVSDALQAAKDYADTAAGLPYTGTAPIAVDANNRVISVTNATTSAKGVMQVGDNMTVNNGVVSVKPWAVHSATAAAVDVNDVQEGALIQTDEPVGGDLTAVIAQVEQTLSGSASLVPSSYAVKSAMESLLAPVYVNGTTGDDANYGDTAATAVKTIGRALALAANRGTSGAPNNVVIIYIEGGTYNENIDVTGRRVRFEANGNVTIAGGCYVVVGGYLNLSGTGFTFVATTTGPNIALAAGSSGVLTIGAPTTVRVPAGLNKNYAVVAAENGVISVGNALTIEAQGVQGAVVSAYAGGVILSNSNSASFTISSNSTGPVAFAVNHGGRIMWYAGTGGISINGTYTSAVLRASNGGSILRSAGVNVSGSPQGRKFYAFRCGTIATEGAATNYLPGSQPGLADASTYGIYS